MAKQAKPQSNDKTAKKEVVETPKTVTSTEKSETPVEIKATESPESTTIKTSPKGDNENPVVSTESQNTTNQAVEVKGQNPKRVPKSKRNPKIKTENSQDPKRPEPAPQNDVIVKAVNEEALLDSKPEKGQNPERKLKPLMCLYNKAGISLSYRTNRGKKRWRIEADAFIPMIKVPQ